MYPTKDGLMPETSKGNPDNAAPPLSQIPIECQNNLTTNNLYSMPHKGIFQPEPNTLICKSGCCCKFIGFYVILYGSIFGIIFPIIGIKNNMIVMTIVGFLIFGGSFIGAMCVFCLLTTEVIFKFSNEMVEITAFTLCKKRTKMVNKYELTNIIFEYSPRQKGVYHSLHILYNNGIQNNYFSFSSNPPCFTKYEVDYFNMEIKRLLDH